MRKSKFSETQIVEIPKGAESGAGDRAAAEAPHQRGDVFKRRSK